MTHEFVSSSFLGDELQFVHIYGPNLLGHVLLLRPCRSLGGADFRQRLRKLLRRESALALALLRCDGAFRGLDTVSFFKTKLAK